MFNKIKKIFHWILPYHCTLCGDHSELEYDLCKECCLSLSILSRACKRCALPLPTNNHLCGQCLQFPPPFHATFSQFLYQGAIITLLLELKFKQKLSHAKLLGNLMVQPLLENWYLKQALPDVIVPVPLHPSRLKQRGFNQALEIARSISTAIQRPIHTRGCQRIKPTLPQSTLEATSRHQNIKGAFKVYENFSGQHIAVIDDVITTGNTMIEFCKVLREQGAKKIDVWCCARAVL